MKKFLIATITIALALGAARLAFADGDDGSRPVDPNTPVADANALAE